MSLSVSHRLVNRTETIRLLYELVALYGILFTEREAAAKWLSVPVEVLMAQR